MAALLNMFGVRAKRSLQQGLTAIRGTKICSSLYHTSLQPFEQFGPGLLVSTVDNFQLDRNKSCLCASVLPRGVKNALETEAHVTRGLTIGEQASCLEEPKASHSHVDYLSFTDKKLLAQCILDTYRASGAGGQHRNKTDSAVRLKHTPTGLVGQAADDRSQHVNKALALNRLRQVIAINVRRPVDLDNYEPPLQLLKILPVASTIKRDRGIGQQVGPKNSSYLQGLQALLDLLGAVKGSVSEAAPRLGLSTGMLSKLITADKVLWQAVNAVRAIQGLKPLR